MKFLRKLIGTKAKIVFATMVALLFTIAPSVARAFSLSDWVAGKVSGGIEWVAFQMSLLLGGIAGFIVLLASYAVQLILQINFDIIHSTIVVIGFPIMLSFANLAFVAGIIIVAIATILHIESYGLKNVLWKLLVMAVLINFGLVIAGTILNFSDNITMYMVKSIAPTADNGGITAFSEAISGAFNPQRNVITGINKVGTNDITSAESAFSVTGNQVGQMLAPIIGLLMSLGSYLIIIVMMTVLVVILLVRYIQLSFLLVSLPLAWAAWPFPQFSKHTSEWWGKFWKQAFYPIPLVFFLWLGLMFAQKLGDVKTAGYTGSDLSGLHTIENSGAGGAIYNFLGGIATPLADNFLRMVLLGGVMFAGLMAANSMGATFAGAGMNALKAGQNKAKNAVANRIKNRGQRIGLKMKGAIAKPRAKLLDIKMKNQRNIELAAAGLLKNKEAADDILRQGEIEAQRLRDKGKTAEAELALDGYRANAERVRNASVKEYEALNALDKANAHLLVAQQKIGDAIQNTTKAPLQAMGYEGHMRLGFNGIPRKRYKVKADSDGKPTLAFHVLEEQDVRVRFKKIQAAHSNKVYGDAMIDESTGEPTTVTDASGKVFYKLFDGSEIEKTSEVSEGVESARNMKEVVFANAEGKAITDAAGNKIWVKKDNDGKYLTDKNENGDLNIKDKNGVIAGVAKKTAVQIEGENGVITTRSSKEFVGPDGKLSTKFADADGHPLHGSSSSQGSYETQDKLEAARKSINSDEHTRETLINEAKNASLVGDVIGVAQETGSALTKGGIPASNKSSGGGGGDGHKPKH